MTKLELAAIRLYKAKLADKQRKAKMNKLVCEREVKGWTVSKQDRPCWKAKWEPHQIDEYGRIEVAGYWDYPTPQDEEGSTDLWCKPCQDRQRLYLDRSVRKELGNAKRSFWAITRSLLKS